MSEFFKQLISQLSAIWQKLSLQQKIVTTSLVAFTLLGMIGLLMWSQSGGKKEAGFKVLYSDLELDKAATVTEALQKANYKYKLDNNGRTIMVEAKQLYEVRMSLAREGLPGKSGLGYELFDKTNLGMTDYVQKLNARRALEGELQRTIEGLEEVKSARVHIVIPEPTIFLDAQKDAKASVVLKCLPGRQLGKEQIRGITNLISSSVDGLKPQNISVVDYGGKLLSSPFGDDDEAIASSHNMELQQNVEKYLENKTNQMLTNILGPLKAYVKIACDLDFDKVERTAENFNPETKVVRSEERIDETVKNAPDGDNQKERSLTNYEIDKTVQKIVQEVGNIKRITISVAVDGRYEMGADKKTTFVARSPEELQNIEDIVKNAVGYDLTRGDQITVSSIKFDNELLREEQLEMQNSERWEKYMQIAKYVLAFFIAAGFLLFLRYLTRTVAEAMNPPLPVLDQFGIEEPVVEDIPDDLKKSSEILERVEMLTQEEPVNIAAIIKQWLAEPANQGKKKK
ncbi:MAG TPA: flagellar basal-body MS-ring/collar protein FliF [Chitinispirillaceae bacterium]|nr:flagellar basal-body MS-ring/collar protein FliF [Chitinispirillaceae bacterium]